jgi:16S rRNA G966 N2-methylase RsmD
MRIIGGKLKGLRFYPPTNLPVRPTTDMAKEALFNILNNQIDFEGLKVLDVDSNVGCIRYLKEISKQHQMNIITPLKADVFRFLKEDNDTFDLIFADPPYDIPQIPLIADLVFERKLLRPDGMLIVEHPSSKRIGNHPNFTEQRKYGNSSFSFFKNSF